MSKINRKGFTLVELAIVLVVIGLILGMAIKGKSLIESARFRVELNKIRKLETAAATFASRTNGRKIPLSPKNNEATTYALDMDLLLNMGLLNSRDLTSNLPGVLTADFMGGWQLFRCELSVDHYGVAGIAKSDNGTSVCAGFAYRYLDETIGQSQMPDKVVCIIEAYLDDENVFMGNGRNNTRFYIGTVDKIKPYYNDCERISDRGVNGGGDPYFTKSYMYVVY